MDSVDGRASVAVSRKPSDRNVVGATARYIESTMPRERPTLPMAARALNTSPRSLQRTLDRAGISYRDLTKRLELDRARVLLRDTDLRLREISQLLGYRDPSSFSRAFRHWTGVSPRDYRRRPN